MSDNLLEILQLGEILGFAVAACMVLFYAMWWDKPEAKAFYLKVLAAAVCVYLVCAYFLRVVHH